MVVVIAVVAVVGVHFAEEATCYVEYLLQDWAVPYPRYHLSYWLWCKQTAQEDEEEEEEQEGELLRRLLFQIPMASVVVESNYHVGGGNGDDGSTDFAPRAPHRYVQTDGSTDFAPRAPHRYVQTDPLLRFDC